METGQPTRPAQQQKTGTTTIEPELPPPAAPGAVAPIVSVGALAAPHHDLQGVSRVSPRAASSMVDLPTTDKPEGPERPIRRCEVSKGSPPPNGRGSQRPPQDGQCKDGRAFHGPRVARVPLTVGAADQPPLGGQRSDDDGHQVRACQDQPNRGGGSLECIVGPSTLRLNPPPLSVGSPRSQGRIKVTWRAVRRRRRGQSGGRRRRLRRRRWRRRWRRWWWWRWWR
jgi:hypothetical protein